MSSLEKQEYTALVEVIESLRSIVEDGDLSEVPMIMASLKYWEGMSSGGVKSDYQEAIECLTTSDFEGCLETVERILSEMEIFETEAGQQ